MHSTSLIGQTLGGAQGTKASPAQDAYKSSSNTAKDRSFADHVDDKRTKPEADTPSKPKNADQGAASSAPKGQADHSTSEKSEKAADPIERQAGSSGAEVVAEAANDLSREQAAVKASASRTDGEMLGQMAREASDAANPQSNDVEGDADMAKRGRMAVPGPTVGDAAAAKASATGQAVSAEAAAKPDLESKGAAHTSQAESDVPLDAAGAKETGRSAKAEAALSEMRRSETGTATPASSQVQGQGRTASQEAVAVQAKLQAGEGDKQSPPSDRGIEGRLQSAGTSPGAPASANPVPASASQSVFQVQVQNAEAGEKRQARYRSREGEVQVAPAVSQASAAAAGVTAPNSAMASANAALSLAQTLQADMAKGSQSASLLADSMASHTSLTAEMPGLSQLLTEAVFQPGATHRVETPRMIATQLAEAFAAKGERNMEVSLNPEELGRVKMRVSTSETGIVMTIQTERPETGDLMRRHINELAEEFRRMGFQDISFEFSSGDSAFGGQTEQGLSDGSGSAAGIRGADTDMAITDEVADTQMKDLRLGTTGVDMRV
jgi:hypothetical protein